MLNQRLPRILDSSMGTWAPAPRAGFGCCVGSAGRDVTCLGAVLRQTQGVAWLSGAVARLVICRGSTYTAQVSERPPRPVPSPQIDATSIVMESLSPIVAISMSLLMAFGLLGGWAGSRWLLALALMIGMALGGAVLNTIWLRLGRTTDSMMLASTLLYLPLTSILVVITGGIESPFWLLFVVGSQGLLSQVHMEHTHT